VKVNDFYESSHFIVDTLKEEFCTKKEDGWYEMKQTVNPSELDEAICSEKKTSDKMKVVPIIAAGKWRPVEHQLFLEALKLYGKDWESIQKHVGTRDISMVQSHAQKFLQRLVKFMDGKAKIAKMSLEEAEFYYGTLNKKLHRWMKKEDQEEAISTEQGDSKEVKEGEFEEPLPLAQKITDLGERVSEMNLASEHVSLKTSKSQFDRWKENVSLKESRKTDHSIGHSIKMMLEKSKDGSESVKLSFKSLLKFVEPEDVEVMSDNSFKLTHADSYGGPYKCSHGTAEANKPN